MDEPLATKEEEGLAPALNVSGSALTGILWPTMYRCPHCRHVYKLVFGPGDVFLGEGKRNCSMCHKAFRDRSKEWVEIRSLDRFFFVFPGFVCAWILMGTIACILFAWLGWSLGTTTMLIPVAIAFAAPLIAWLIFRNAQIVRSLHRSSLRGRTKPA